MSVAAFLGLLLAFASRSPSTLEEVASETQRVMVDFFQQAPQYQATVNSVHLDRTQGHDYYGTAELILDGTMIRQELHVHLEDGQLQWETQAPTPPAQAH